MISPRILVLFSATEERRRGHTPCLRVLDAAELGPAGACLLKFSLELASELLLLYQVLFLSEEASIGPLDHASRLRQNDVDDQVFAI